MDFVNKRSLYMYYSSTIEYLYFQLYCLQLGIGVGKPELEEKSG